MMTHGTAEVCVCVADDPSDTLAEALSDAVATGLGTPYRPREIVFASDLPKTRNMKIMRRVVRSLYAGRDPGDLSSLVNPQVMEELERALRR